MSAEPHDAPEEPTLSQLTTDQSTDLTPEVQGPAGLRDHQGRYVRFTQHALLRAMQRCQPAAGADYTSASRFLAGQWRGRIEASVCASNEDGVRWHWRCPACVLVAESSGALVRILTVLPREGRARYGRHLT